MDKELIAYSKMPIKGTSDYYETSHFADGSYVTRRYNGYGHLMDIITCKAAGTPVYHETASN